MPTQRGSVLFGDELDELGTELVNLIEVVELVTGDGVVTPDETKLIKIHATRTRTKFAPLPGHAAEQDDAFRCIGAIAGAGKVTSRHVKSLINQAGADVEAMRSAA